MNKIRPYLMMIFMLGLLFISPLVIHAQDEIPTAQVTPVPTEIVSNELTISEAPAGQDLPDELYIAAILALLIVLVKEARAWKTESDILKTLEKIVSSQDTVRAAEIRYDNAGMQTQAFIKTIDGFAKGFERLALAVAPHSPVTKAIDLLEDFTDEITDGEPSDDKTDLASGHPVMP